MVMPVNPYRSREFVMCPRNNPETYKPCTLPDTAAAHHDGHKSIREEGTAVYWEIDYYDRNRWEST